MAGVVAPPDIEAELIKAAYTEFSARPATVGWQVKGPYPCLRLVRSGGTTDQILRVDAALIQAEAWGDPGVTSSAQRIALSALLGDFDAWLLGHVPGLVTAGAVFTRVRPLVRGQWAPDEETNQQRYLSRHIVAAHAV